MEETCIREILVRQIVLCGNVNECVSLHLITCPLLYYIDTEREAARITSSILSAVAYLHQRSITHR